MRFFIFYFIFFTSIGLYLHAHPKPKITEKFQLPYFQKSNGILHVFELPRAYILPKQQTFFVFRSKNEKKNNNFKKKKKWKSEFCKIKCAQKIKCGRQLWDTEFFFSLNNWNSRLKLVMCVDPCTLFWKSLPVPPKLGELLCHKNWVRS